MPASLQTSQVIPCPTQQGQLPVQPGGHGVHVMLAWEASLLPISAVEGRRRLRLHMHSMRKCCQCVSAVKPPQHQHTPQAAASCTLHGRSVEGVGMAMGTMPVVMPGGGLQMASGIPIQHSSVGMMGIPTVPQ